MSTGLGLTRFFTRKQEKAKTSSPKSLTFSPLVLVQDGTEAPAPGWASPPSSPLSSASTIDDWELSSPVLPALQAPQLSSTATGYLRTPSPPDSSVEGHYVITSWGSPYPQTDTNHLRRSSSSSGSSDESSPLHQLEIDTRFLRPAPLLSDTQSTSAQSNLSLSASAAVLANRARRPLWGITEEWIRQHTTHDLGSEPRHWLSDGTDGSEHSSLSSSIASNGAAWFEEANPRTPRPTLRPIRPPSSVLRHSRDRSSNETLKAEAVHSSASDMADTMDSVSVDRTQQDASSIFTLESSSDITTRPVTPLKHNLASVDGLAHGLMVEPARPTTPAISIKPALSKTPRPRKKVPWRGKNILVLLPRDEERGQPGGPPMPLDAASTEAMLRSWEQLGYSTRGFDLVAYDSEEVSQMNSRSRDEWPSPADITEERLSRQYQVILPDLNAWKEYVNELAEAKLRALGVTFAEEEPVPQSVSPVPSMSRQASNQLQPFPFSPPLPTSSVISNGPHGFPFPATFFQPGMSASQSPGMQVASPVPISAPGPMKYNSRASISVSPHELQFLPGQPSPLGWTPHMLLQQQHHGRHGSPSALHMMSPGSPFSPDGMSSPIGIHQRHQSLQYPMHTHTYLQRQDSTRASPRLEEVREDEEEEEIRTNPYDQSPAKTPEPAPFMQHNPSDSLQKEIDEAEYHLEEQFRSQLEHEDYSPHNEAGPLQTDVPADNFATTEALNAQCQSVHFSGVRADSDEGPQLHHPQPHNRGHSLSQNPYYDNDEVRESIDEDSIRKSQPSINDSAKADHSYEVETNPSDIGTPAHTYDSMTEGHDRSQSTTSNPWAESESFVASNVHSRQGSNNSKTSLSSKLNASAAEFKFNPKSNFTPGQFVFGTNPQAKSFAPAPPVSQPAASNQLDVPSNASSTTVDKINPTAPVFSPQKSDFSFSTTGPKFNPDAKAFQPVHSPTSTAGSGKKSSPKPIFGTISLGSPESLKQSKAVPVSRSSGSNPTSPSLQPATTDATSSNRELLPGDASRIKKQFRSSDNADGDDVPRFAEPTSAPLDLLPEPEVQSSPSDSQAKIIDEPEAAIVPAESNDDQDENVNVADVTLESIAVSESTEEGKVPSESNETNDTKATTSPSAESPDPDTASWRPIEFTTESDIHDFKHGGPLADQEPISNEPEKPHLSAAARALVPGGLMFGTPEMVNTPFNPEFVTQPEQLDSLDELGDDSAGSPTPGPDFPVVTVTEMEKTQSTKHAPPIKSGLMASRFASSPSASLKSFEEGEHRYVPSPSPVSEAPPTGSNDLLEEVSDAQHIYEPLPLSPPSDASTSSWNFRSHELTFEEIDAVMKQINENDPTMGVKRLMESSNWRRAHSAQSNAPEGTNTLPVPLSAQEPVRDESHSPSPHAHQSLPHKHAYSKPSTELGEPLINAMHSMPSQFVDGPVRRLNTGGNIPESDWDDAFSASEHGKFEQRVQYFDGHVNSLLGNLLTSRLDPLENTLSSIQHVLSKLPQRATSSRRGRRSVSELQESDADDEDEELPTRRSPSPRRDRKLKEQIRVAIMDGLSQHQIARALEPTEFAPVEDNQPKAEMAVMKALDEMKLQIAESIPKFRAEDIRNIVEQAVNNRTPLAPLPISEGDNEELAEMKSTLQSLEKRLHAEESRADTERSRVYEMEEKLRISEAKIESEIAVRRAAEDRTADLRRQLEQAETKVEVEIMNRSIFDQRIHDLEERLRAQERTAEQELATRREAEDRLAESQRLFRISCEEEDRLRAVILERDQKIKSIEQSSGKTSMRLTFLETAQANAERDHGELRNRLNAAETELRESRQEARHWRFEAEQARDSATQQADNLVRSVNENKHLRKLIDTLRVQLEENERIRENWRAKFVSLQDDMAHAAREITEESSRRTRREQSLIARHEVLDARLHAEARTRERLEKEIERLEDGERAGMRAVSECKRVETLLAEVRNDNHHLHQLARRAQREAQEARDNANSEKEKAQSDIQATKASLGDQLQRVQLELQEARRFAAVEVDRAQLEIQAVKDSAAMEVDRAQQEALEAKQSADMETQNTRDSVALELESARDQVNIVRADFEEEVAKLKAELDQVRLDADTANARHDMLLEDAQTTKEAEIRALKNAKASELEDLQARYDRQISNAAEDAQRHEQNLLERLSLSASKTEHLQDRVAHLEERLQIAQEAARAAAQAATQASKAVALPELSSQPGPISQTKQLAQAMQFPEKISPQALRESIMVLQEQLQDREQRIEEFEQKVAELDPDAATKISKRDDEIMWLRELLAVRHGDLQDIITALSGDRFNKDAVKDAAIRLKANLQMEEQERERAMNGGSALNLPNIAATISKAATPRVAQAVGPIAAAWGNWRKSSQYVRNISGAMASPATSTAATLSRSKPASSHNRASGLMTPPTPGIHSTPQAEPSQEQPTAFGNTGRRYTAEQFANRSRGGSLTARQAEKMPVTITPPPRPELKVPHTPPMMQSNSYDNDACMEEFDDASFFDD